MSTPFPALNSGDLNTKIEIVRAAQQDDGLGGFTTIWTAIASPWAEVIGQDGREAVIGHVLQGISVYRIRIRYRTDILPSDQIRLGGAGGIDLNVKSCSDPAGRREQWMIIASTDGAQKTA